MLKNITQKLINYIFIYLFNQSNCISDGVDQCTDTNGILQSLGSSGFSCYDSERCNTCANCRCEQNGVLTRGEACTMKLCEFIEKNIY